MRHNFAHDATHEDLFLAGEKVRPGIYRQIGGEREVKLEREDFLPASLDGRVACYTCVTAAWGQRKHPEAVQA